ncbi:MAG: HAMP domain-containing histidine kinase [Eubacteriaceae bacterium]|nr:HAMP domain-containing histidine kinase [Eubacteriaceae bacterium]
MSVLLLAIDDFKMLYKEVQLSLYITNVLINYFLLRYVEKTKRHRFGSWAIVVTVFMITFPIIFFNCGGYKSGTSPFFVVAIVITSQLLDNKNERYIAMAIELALYISCIILDYKGMGYSLVSHTDFDYYLGVLVNFLYSCIFLVLAMLIRSRLAENRQEENKALYLELLNRNEELAEYVKMKNDILSIAVHEINRPLAVIKASSSDTLYLIEESPIDREEIMRNHEMITRRVNSISGILLELIDAVAVEMGNYPLNRSPLPMAIFMQYVCSEHFDRIDTNGNMLKFKLEEGMPDLNVDREKIEMVLTNLLSNAVEHTKGGTITVMAARSNGKQYVSVSDTGEGMGEEALRRVFEEQFTTKNEQWRHGYGLFTCRRIIAAHGGDIWVESAIGQGTTVFFTLSEDVEHG